MANNRKAKALLALLAALPFAPFTRAETLTHSVTLPRAAIEAKKAIDLVAADTAATTTHLLELKLRFTERPPVSDGGAIWRYAVHYSVSAPGGSKTDRSLTLFRGDERDVFEAVDRIPWTASSAQIRFVAVQTLDSSAVPGNITFAATLASTRFSAFQPQTAPTLTVSTDKTRVNWTAVAGAEEYDVEIAFIDSFDKAIPTANANVFAAVLPLRFQTNELSIAHDEHRRTGTTHYRIRAVGRHVSAPSERRPGSWSKPVSITFSEPEAFERNKNWEYRRQYQRDGPAKADVRFFDGALRARQSQSGAPDQTTRLIAETKHDHEGRAAAEFLPAPAPGLRLQHAAGFNRGDDGQPFAALHFDWSGSRPASTASGAGRYFSPQGDVAGPASEFVPNANGYPYSVTRYTRDLSGRVRSASGVGSALREGSGHEALFIYGDAAEQQLRPLFGKNVGTTEHYERTVTADPNRSFQVVYRDGANRIIAQALLGNAPPGVADLPDAPAAVTQTVSMSANNRVDTQAGKSTLSYRIANGATTRYHFTYVPSGIEYGVDPADKRFPTLCETCRYQLRIRVIGPSGTSIPLVSNASADDNPTCSGVDPVKGPFEVSQVIANPKSSLVCKDGKDFTTVFSDAPVKFCAIFTEPGEYEVQKTLELTKGVIEKQISGYEGTKGYFHVEDALKAAPVDPATCGASCVEHCKQATGIDPASQPNHPQLNQCVRQCERPTWTADLAPDKCERLDRELARDLKQRISWAGSGRPVVGEHTEQCHVNVCREMAASDQYDLELGTVSTYAEALCRGFLNPLAMPTDPNLGPPPATVCAGAASPTPDPVFAPGGRLRSLRADFTQQLSNYTSTLADTSTLYGWSEAPMSVWQFAADLRMHPQSAVPSADDQWRVFRSLYLGLKRRLVTAATEDPAVFDCPFSNDPNAHVKRPPDAATLNELLGATGSALGTYCSTTCAARVSGWLDQLKSQCSKFSNQPEVGAGLLEHCLSTCGTANPLGVLTKTELAKGSPGLGRAQKAIDGCPLAGLAVDDPYIRQTVCTNQCCSDQAVGRCAELFLGVLRERLPGAPQEHILSQTPTGQQLQGTCFKDSYSVRIGDGFAVLKDKAGRELCGILLFGPDGQPLPFDKSRITGPLQVRTASKVPVANTPLMYTGLVVPVDVAGTVVMASIYSSCKGLWTEALKQPQCLVRTTHDGAGAGAMSPPWVCKPASSPAPCLVALLERVRIPSVSASSTCFQNATSTTTALDVQTTAGTRCQLVAADSTGQVRVLTELIQRPARWMGSSSRQALGSLQFTGYVVDTPSGQLYLYTDCPFNESPSCTSVIVDVKRPAAPVFADPTGVCRAAVDQANQQRAQYSVEVAKQQFSEFFANVHYNRCFSSELREQFFYQASGREYHYTLWYYDQAGNLVQTVPPLGVAPWSSADVAAYAAGTAIAAPAHRMKSRFRYDSLNRLIAEETPDAGERTFLFDRAHRRRFSQDAQQQVDGAYSYTKYDRYSRPVELGQVKGPSEATIRTQIDQVDFPTTSDGTLSDVVRTHYDTVVGAPVCTTLAPQNLRGRVAAVVAETAIGASVLCYSYDTMGRTVAVLRDLPGLGSKRITYELDPVTGRMNASSYQAGQPDALHRRLTFNRLGQLTIAESSRDSVLWDRDAAHSHYAYGPLARTELGQDRIQGLDYTYTIDGRPKGLNSGALLTDRDPGRDGAAAGTNMLVPADVVGLSLDYFPGDYAAVGAVTSLSSASLPHPPSPSGSALYDGNVVSTTVGLEGIGSNARVTGFKYSYDRLYRLKDSNSQLGFDQSSNAWASTPQVGPWRTSLTYDENGNIRTLDRAAPSASSPAGVAMDTLTYQYPVDPTDTTGKNILSNRLLQVNDAVAQAVFPNDLDDQGTFAPTDAATHNYAYDRVGRLLRDKAHDLKAIRWTSTNRVTRIEKTDSTLDYFYDGLLLRFAKVQSPVGTAPKGPIEYFVRDEEGRLLATYKGESVNLAKPAVLGELYIYGSSLLGTHGPHLADSFSLPGLPRVRGNKRYQIENHLGHVLATVTDRRASKNKGSGYEARTLSITDYDPFGAVLPGRFNELSPYRFGFGGFERDDEVKQTAVSYYTHERLFDARLARWLSPDPILSAEINPYAAMNNNPLRFRDPTGAQAQVVHDFAERQERDAEATAQEYINQEQGAAATVWLLNAAGWTVVKHMVPTEQDISVLVAGGPQMAGMNMANTRAVKAYKWLAAFAKRFRRGSRPEVSATHREIAEVLRRRTLAGDIDRDWDTPIGLGPIAPRRAKWLNAALSIEKHLGVRLSAAPKGAKFDWLDADGNSWDLMETGPGKYFNLDNFLHRLDEHLRLKAKYVPIVIDDLTPAQQSSLFEAVDRLPAEMKDRVFWLRQPVETGP